MRILFMGTTDFAAACLDAAVKAGYPVAAVCTKADRPKNRGMKLVASPVKAYAQKAGLPVLQPTELRSAESQAALRAVGAELFLVVAYGKLLPKAVLALPRLGCVNVHASLLPKYRGAAPIQWAVLNGEKETGVTTMYLAEEMDAGDVLDRAALPIGQTESFGSVYGRLMTLGAELMVKTLGDIEAGRAAAQPQDPALVTFAPPITKALCPVDWSASPENILHRVCGLDPKPGATARFGETEYKLFSPALTELRTELSPGSVVGSDKKGLLVACGGGEVLRIRELQAPGGKRMAAADYLRGHAL